MRYKNAVVGVLSERIEAGAMSAAAIRVEQNGTSRDEWRTLKLCGNLVATALCG